MGVPLRGDTDDGDSMPPYMVVKWVVCAATSSGDFDTEVQSALVGRVGVNEGDIADLKYTAQGVIPSSIVVGSGSASVAADGTVTFVGASSVALNDAFDGVSPDMSLYEISFQLVTSVRPPYIGE